MLLSLREPNIEILVNVRIKISRTTDYLEVSWISWMVVLDTRMLTFRVFEGNLQAMVLIHPLYKQLPVLQDFVSHSKINQLNKHSPHKSKTYVGASFGEGNV